MSFCVTLETRTKFVIGLYKILGSNINTMKVTHFPYTPCPQTKGMVSTNGLERKTKCKYITTNRLIEIKEFNVKVFQILTIFSLFGLSFIGIAPPKGPNEPVSQDK